MYNKQIQKLTAERDLLKSQVRQKRYRLTLGEKEVRYLKEARTFIVEIAKKTQGNFKGVVERLVTVALQSTFDDRNFEFKLRFENKANRTQVVPVIMEDGVEWVAKNDMGGGLIDVVSFALRLILWSMQEKESRGVFVLDEPFKFMDKKGLVEKIGPMLQEFSKMGIQIIMCTHEPELKNIADRSFNIRFDGKKSIVDFASDGLVFPKKEIGKERKRRRKRK